MAVIAALAAAGIFNENGNVTSTPAAAAATAATGYSS
jgi:hypothetical protein